MLLAKDQIIQVKDLEINAKDDVIKAKQSMIDQQGARIDELQTMQNSNAKEIQRLKPVDNKLAAFKAKGVQAKKELDLICLMWKNSAAYRSLLGEDKEISALCTIGKTFNLGLPPCVTFNGNDVLYIECVTG
ncbi:hypothetical protein CBOM_01373 [Ceraceosorus bombacis]|uniref:Uncharacterized protein n=1 Tax=Ceraceosorus bombacis TaxID=401625 RepID=A0A0N7L9D1_9BASI|nr:hypothetical protein CBOM_01373 [Ceraceosorus bombacis]